MHVMQAGAVGNSKWRTASRRSGLLWQQRRQSSSWCFRHPCPPWAASQLSQSCLPPPVSRVSASEAATTFSGALTQSL
jgi:hypothetical protein